MAGYELWLTDDLGNRMALLTDFGEPSFFAYTRAVNGLGTINFGLPFRPFEQKFSPYFRPDWRVEVWRSPAYGIPMRREDVYILRKPHVFLREDNVEILQFYGRNGLDLLYRRSVIQRGGTSWARKTDLADDMMKEIVREQMLFGSSLDEDGVQDDTRAWPEDEFSVQTDAGLGPSMSLAFADKKVIDVLKQIKDNTRQLNVEDAANRRIYFDVVPVSLAEGSAPSGSRLGWEFRTYADLRGMNRTTNGVTFSPENENIGSPAYSKSHLDEYNSVVVRGNGKGKTQIVEVVDATGRIQSSRWNRIEAVISARNETTTAGLRAAGRAALNKGKPIQEFQGTFLNTPGRKDVPQSLYGIDWDLGDRVRANYAGRQFNVDINVVYVNVDDSGKEDIMGRSEVQE